MNLDTAVNALRTTGAAVIGQTGDLFSAPGEIFEATLEIDSEASVPSSTELLKPGSRHDALIRLGRTSERSSTIRSVSLKVADAYGPGRDQDFLLASSGDGAPLHHATLPASDTEPALYSSLWLYLAGLTPVLFGVKTDHGKLGEGDTAEFVISAPIGKFRRIGTATIGSVWNDSSEPVFAARNSGGNIRPLPPVNFY